MREKYESLSVVVLREVAKARGLTHLSGLKKSELVDLMVQEDEKESNQNNAGKAAGGTEEAQEKKKQGSPATKGAGKAGQERKSLGKAGQEKNVKDQEKPERNPKEKPGQEQSQRERGAQGKRGVQEREGQERAAQEKRNIQERGGQERGAQHGTQEKGIQEPGTQERGVQERSWQDSRSVQERMERRPNRVVTADGIEIDNPELDSGISAHGILEVMPDGYGFIRCENYLPGDHDVYVSPSQIRKFGLKTGDIILGNTRVKTQQEKFSALLYIKSINGCHPSAILKRPNFEDLTPIFPNSRIRLETERSAVAMRIMDVVSPIGKGQRGMIVSPPKAGKTTLLKQVAKAVTRNHPQMHLIILLIDERPEEVTDIKEAIEGENVEVIYSTFDELPEHHKRVSEMVIERARRLVEHRKDVMILLDSITRLARAYNLIVPPSGRTLSGGIDPAALHMPKRFFGAARNMREGGSITILATALVDTGSRMDDVIYEEFKGTGNMELILDRKLSERRIFPAVDIVKSGTRREDLLLSREEQEAVEVMRRAINGMRSDEAVESILNLFVRTNSNREFCQVVKKTKLI